MNQTLSTFRLAEQAGREEAELSLPVQVVTIGQLEELRTTMQNIAADDAELRAALLNDPKGTVSELVRLNTSGTYEMSELLDVVILENSNKVVNIVIPSIEKIDGVDGEIAELARALDADPTLQAALKASPRETLESLMKTIESENLELPTDRAINVVIEQPDQLYLVLPESAAPLQDMVTESEIGAPLRFDPHMSCFTCECFSNGPCFTGQCFSSSMCFSYSNKC